MSRCYLALDGKHHCLSLGAAANVNCGYLYMVMPKNRIPILDYHFHASRIRRVILFIKHSQCLVLFCLLKQEIIHLNIQNQ